ncbi:MAG: hypothetical protein WA006_08625 [Rhodoglobus sp.]
MNRLLPAFAIAAILVTTGCGTFEIPGGPTPSPTPTRTQASTPTPTPTPAPTRTPAPGFEGEVLFTVAAKLTSPDGATANLKQTVYLPVDGLDELDGVEGLLDEQCGDWRENLGDESFLVSEITATDTSAAGQVWEDTPQFVVTMAGTSVFLGDVEPFHAFCTSVQGFVPGVSLAVSPLPSDVEPDEPGGWATFAYGFGVIDEDAMITQCRISVSDEGKTRSTLVRTWPGLRQDPGFCEVNTLGL